MIIMSPLNSMAKFTFSFLSSILLFTGLALFLTALVGCSSSKDHSALGTVLTHIRDDGSKLFVFTSKTTRRVPRQVQEGNPQTGLPHPSKTQTQPNKSAQRSRMARRQNSGGRTGNALLLIHLLKALEQRLEHTGYCREGYLPLGSYLEFGQFEIRGECRETATKEDRLMFPDGTVY